MIFICLVRTVNHDLSLALHTVAHIRAQQLHYHFISLFRHTRSVNPAHKCLTDRCRAERTHHFHFCHLSVGTLHHAPQLCLYDLIRYRRKIRFHIL